MDIVLQLRHGEKGREREKGAGLGKQTQGKGGRERERVANSFLGSGDGATRFQGLNKLGLLLDVGTCERHATPTVRLTRAKRCVIRQSMEPVGSPTKIEGTLRRKKRSEERERERAGLSHCC